MSASRSSPATATAAVDRPARRLSRLCLILSVGLVPVVALVFALGWPEILRSAIPAMNVNIDVGSLAGWRVALIFVLALLPVSLMAMALLQASRCLAVFARGHYFSAQAVHHMRRFAAFVFLAGIAGVLVPTLVILIATTAGPGPSSLTISFGSDDLYLLLFAGISWQIAAVLARAVTLADDHAQIV